MTPEDRKRLACTSKQRYPTEAAAAAKITASTQHRRCELSILPCEYCKGFHIWHVAGSKRHCISRQRTFDDAVAEWIEKFGTDNRENQA